MDWLNRLQPHEDILRPLTPTSTDVIKEQRKFSSLKFVLTEDAVAVCVSVCRCVCMCVSHLLIMFILLMSSRTLEKVVMPAAA